MPIDTKKFDDAIIAKDAEVQTAQATLEADPLQVQLNATKAKQTDLNNKHGEKISLEQKKARAVELQGIIDSAQTELDAILSSVK